MGWMQWHCWLGETMIVSPRTVNAASACEALGLAELRWATMLLKDGRSEASRCFTENVV